jgi:DNA-binding response OmpR family regulator
MYQHLGARGRVEHILIIDDDAVTVRVLPALLRSRLPDATVDTATDAQTALSLVRSGHYQLLLIDVRMPSVDGLRLLRDLRGCAPNTRVIIMTSRLDESLKVETSQIGVYAFLSKPLFPDLVIAKAQAALQRTPS